MSILVSSTSWMRRPSMRRNPIPHLRTSSIWQPISRGPRDWIWHMPRWQAASASASSLPRPTAIQNIGNARSNAYKGSLQTGPSEDQNGRRRWAGIKDAITAFDPALIARDAKEEARAGALDHRYNHWTAVRDGLMNAHADIFPQVPAIARALPNPIDQMKLFELIQIIPSPTKAALSSGNLAGYQNFRPDGHGLFAQQQHLRLRPTPTGPRHPRVSARFSTRCGCSTINSNARSPNSPRSKRGRRPRPEGHAHRIVGMTNSEPSLVPEGQRAVTVLVLV